MKMSNPRLYPAHRLYSLMTIVGIGVALLFAWTLTNRFDWFDLIFFVVASLFALINLRWMFTRGELTPSGLTLHEPLTGPTHIDFRQMVAVFEAGRMLPGVSLVYYPLRENGLLEMDEPHTLFLPAMERQDELLAVLNHEIPE